MNLLYLVKRALTARDFERFGVEYMLDQGHQVTVLDLGHLIHPNLPNDQTNVVKDARILNRVMRDWSDLEAERSTFARSDLVMFLIQGFGLSRAVLRPLRMLAQVGVPYLIQCSPLFPGWKTDVVSLTAGDRLAGIWKRLQRMDALNSLNSRIRPAWLGLPTARYAVTIGTTAMRRNNLIGPTTELIVTHAHDYDIFLREKAKKPVQRNQAVFIDQFLPFHFDYVEFKIKPFDANAYYACLNRLFRQIERQFGLEVVIAAHPRAEYRDNDPLYEGRKVVKGATARLVLESRLVVGHVSLAIGFAIMARKPFLLVTTQETYEKVESERHYYDGFARELGTKLHFLDAGQSIDLAGALHFDEDRYSTYLNKYLVNSAAVDKLSWQIVNEHIVGAGCTEFRSMSLSN